MLIKKVYQADPLLCPRRGGIMKIIAFIAAPRDCRGEARQGDLVRRILEHCGLWEEPGRGPPLPAPPSILPQAETDPLTRQYCSGCLGIQGWQVLCTQSHRPKQARR